MDLLFMQFDWIVQTQFVLKQSSSDWFQHNMLGQTGDVHRFFAHAILHWNSTFVFSVTVFSQKGNPVHLLPQLEMQIENICLCIYYGSSEPLTKTEQEATPPNSFYLG